MRNIKLSALQDSFSEKKGLRLLQIKTTFKNYDSKLHHASKQWVEKNDDGSSSISTRPIVRHYRI